MKMILPIALLGALMVAGCDQKTEESKAPATPPAGEQTGMCGMGGMSGEQSGMSGMSGMGGMSGEQSGMSGMSGMGGMSGEQSGMSGMSGMGGMSGEQKPAGNQ
ncbi:MAG TPA: hypothetical protein PLJ34_05200 [Hyphomicrobiales bacterium]|nr:hypothetical protein [Hyphomicrobiales bacterium]